MDRLRDELCNRAMAGIDLKIDPERGRAEVVYRGELNADGVLSAFDALINHDDWSPDLSRLYVYGDDVLMGDFRADDRRRFMRFRAEARRDRLPGRDTAAAHVCPDPIKRTFLHFWIDIVGERDNNKVRIFADLDEAEAWLSAHGRNRDPRTASDQASSGIVPRDQELVNSG
jgi:hypothetical protein